MSSRLTVRLLRIVALAAVVVCGLILAGSRSAAAHDYCGPSSCPDLFYNYYVPPVTCACAGLGVGVEMYPCPRPTPPLVGHTYITYQPLMPHEFLYRHHRCYYRDNGPYAGITRAYVCWW
jgi:hypothetical protein